MVKQNAAARFIARRIEAMRQRKSQREIAIEAGFPNPNMLSMIKTGTSKVPIDRVPGLASALECDAAYLFRLVLEQNFEGPALVTVRQIFGSVLTKNETEWIEVIRDASNNSDPHLTAGKRRIVRAMFGNV